MAGDGETATVGDGQRKLDRALLLFVALVTTSGTGTFLARQPSENDMKAVVRSEVKGIEDKVDDLETRLTRIEERLKIKAGE